MIAALLLAQVTMNLASPQQTVEGWGVGFFTDAYDYPLPWIDCLFTNNCAWDSRVGLGLTHLRMACDVDSTPYTATALKSWRNIVEASKRGAVVIGAAWDAPAADKTGTTLNAGAGTTDFCTKVVNCIKNAAQQGVTVARFSLMNEPDFSGALVQMTAAQYVTAVDACGPTLAALTPTVPLIGVDASQSQNVGAYLTAIEADGSAPGLISRYSYHEYGSPSVSTVSSTAKAHWMSEHGYQTAFDKTMVDALKVALDIHTEETNNNVTMWSFVSSSNAGSSAVGAGTDNSCFVGTQGDAIDNPQFTKRYYVVGNFSKFVRPGMVRYGITGSPPANVSVTTFQGVGATVVVAVNNQASTAALTVTLDSASAIRAVVPWVTDATNNLAAQSPLTVSAHAFTYTLSANSVTTFVGNGT